MATYVQESGVWLAPHAKTALSPDLASMQLAAGAWGLTVASPQQARIFLARGVRRLLIANEVVDPAELRWIGSQCDSGSRTQVLFYVDSVDGARIASAALRGRARTQPVLLEVGMTGGRAGVRTADEALSVSEAIRASAALKLAGIAGFEGIIPGPNTPARLDRVTEYLRHLMQIAEIVIDGDYIDGDEVILTAGGSSFFRQVVSVLRGPPISGRSRRVIIRSGCYLTGDSGVIRDTNIFAGAGSTPHLETAIELWSRVLSRPEPPLAILDFGKRDAGWDSGFPAVVRAFGGDMRERVMHKDEQIISLNDQHAYLRLQEHSPISVGDLVQLGISHPCTTLDKWRTLPVVADDGTVLRVVHTYFG